MKAVACGKGRITNGFASHRTIKHSKKEYVSGDVHTNSVEGVFSLLKRSIVGVFHQSKCHLHRYCDEAKSKYNTRTALGFTDSDRAAALVALTEGKRTHLPLGRRVGKA